VVVVTGGFVVVVVLDVVVLDVVVVLDDVVVDEVLVLDEEVGVVLPPSLPPERARTAITAMSTTARATRPPISQRIPLDMPPSSAGGCPPPPGCPGSPGPPAAPPAAAAPATPAAAAAGIAIVESGAGSGTT